MTDVDGPLPLEARLAALSPAQRQLLERRLEASRRERAEEPIAVVGMACRFPGADDVPSLLRLLRHGGDAVREVPEGRWDAAALYDADPGTPGKMASRWGGFLGDIDSFDAAFFGISPREAVHMDPQQRLLLEVGWHALEDAGIRPSTLAGSDTGVFVGIMSADYGHTRYASLDVIDAYAGSGNAYGMTANRLSYQLDLRGPSLAVDTACSSSLVALHLACRSLRAGETALALVGGVNVILWPGHTVYFTKAGLIAADGHCKTFDARADGIVRGEGAGMVVLKRFSAARRDGDRVLAVVRGSAVNQDGRSNGITAPSPAAQRAVLRAAYERAGVPPADVGYVEAHGTGTALGDPIEANALGAVLGVGRPAGSRCAVGSIKTNFGHLEAAAGIAGLVKAVLSVSRGEIFPHLHFEEPNPEIPFDDLPLRVPIALEPWPAGTPRIAGVSSFGFGGTNAHVVVEAAPGDGQPVLPPRSRTLLTLGARTREGVAAQAARFASALSPEGGDAGPGLVEAAATANGRREPFRHRVAVHGRTAAEVSRRMHAFARGDEAEGVVHGAAGTPPRIAFLFTGQGSQYEGMGRDLYETDATFRDALDRCDAILRPWLPEPLLAVMYPAPGAPRGLLDQTRYTQPALFALEYALVELWRSWGVRPVAVLGHSVGGLAAAWAAGVFGLEDALRVVAERGRLMQALPGGGAMVSARIDEERARELLEDLVDRLSIAAVNGPRSVVLSGDGVALEELVRRLEDQGVEARRLEVSHAFHSPLMEPALGPLEAAFAGVEIAGPKVDLVSDLTGEVASRDVLGAPGYWVRHARETVRFAAGVACLRELGCDAFLEIGPRPTLVGMAAAVGDLDTALWLPSLRKGTDAWESLLGSLGRLHVRGAPVAWRAVDGGLPPVSLPGYPFQRTRHWLPATAGAQPAAPAGIRRVRSPALAADVWETAYDGDGAATLLDHRILGEMVVPGAGHLAMALSAAADGGDGVPEVRDLAFLRPLTVGGAERHVVQLVRDPRTDTVEFHGRRVDVEEASWTLLATGVLPASDDGRTRPAPPPSPAGADAHEDVRTRCSEDLSAEALAEDVGGGRLSLGPSMRWLGAVRRRDGEAVADVRPPSPAAPAEALPAGLLDSCFRLLAATLPREARTVPRLPFRIARCRHHGGLHRAVWCHAVLRGGEADGAPTTGAVVGDVRLLDEGGDLLLEMEGLELRRVGLASPRRWLYEVAWRVAPLIAPSTAPAFAASSASPGSPAAPGGSSRAPRRWLVFTGDAGPGRDLARELRRGGDATVEVRVGEEYRGSADGVAMVRPGEPGDFRALVDSVVTGEGGCAGVVHLWCLEGEDPAADPQGNVAAGPAGLGSLLHLAQALATVGDGAPALWVVTRGAQVAGSSPEPVRPGQAPVWGLSAVLTAELSWCRTVCVDLDPAAPGTPSQGGEAGALAEELRHPDGDGRIAYRGGERRVARLVRAGEAAALDGKAAALDGKAAALADGKAAALADGKAAAPAHGMPPLRADGSYLVAGGLGALGLHVADWLATQGAGTVVLVGRGAPSPQALGSIAALEARGVRVLVRRADVSDGEAVAALVAEVDGGPHRLRGVVHVAGVVDDGAVPLQSWERFRRVLAPKVDGAWNLHVHTRHLGLDLFLLFSSTAPLLGPPGQSSYAAANAFLDALAHHRRSLGMNALSVNWGPWSGGGMAGDVAETIRQRWREAGISMIEPAEALEALGALQAGGRTQAAVFPVDWGRFPAAFSGGAVPSLLRDLVADATLPHRRFDASGADGEAPGGEAPEEPGGLAHRLRGAAPEGRRAVLEERIRREARRVLRLPAEAAIGEGESLLRLGLDSLMAVEIRNALQLATGRPLPGTVVLDNPTVAGMARWLEEAMEQGG